MSHNPKLLRKPQHLNMKLFTFNNRKLLRVPWTARRSKQSILKKISPEYSLEGLMLKLKFQYFGHLMRRTDLRKDPDAGKDWRQEEKGTTEDETVGWHHRLNGRVWASSGSCWRTEKPGMLQFMGSWRVGHDWATELTDFRLSKKPSFIVNINNQQQEM